MLVDEACLWKGGRAMLVEDELWRYQVCIGEGRRWRRSNAGGGRGASVEWRSSRDSGGRRGPSVKRRCRRGCVREACFAGGGGALEEEAAPYTRTRWLHTVHGGGGARRSGRRRVGLERQTIGIIDLEIKELLYISWSGMFCNGCC